MEDARENLNSNLSPSTNEFERLRTLPPLFPESSVQYSVSMGEINSVVMASSTFEAAIKFAFWLNETRLIQANATNVEISYGGDRYIYTMEDLHMEESQMLSYVTWSESLSSVRTMLQIN